ncbi:MAG TPA: UDP-N-acetylmuramate--L-alanine ligase [Phycisphaerae bacterium]|nr:UDP-N-acetylmuramate--L-alanine ligase [Phycisphaerae bacterium]HOM50556.1 UDP-N-acetylmuramate--L-alanine ligase [Phycisphaerae bacterium]
MDRSARTRCLSDRGTKLEYHPLGGNGNGGKVIVRAVSETRQHDGSAAGSLDTSAEWTARGKRVHLIGIGGCGMSGAAAVLQRRGAVVSGSDRVDSAVLQRLAEQGVNVFIGQKGENVPASCDLVVCSAAVKESNPELQAARRNGARVVKYAQLLGLLMREFEGVAIAGTHGKSTTSAMVSYVLREVGLDPSFVIGAGVEQLGGGSGVGSGRQFVVEACEYDRSFHNLRPRIATILNIEEDHLDYYRDLDEIIESFRTFAQLLPADGLLVVNGDDRNAMRAAADIPAEVQTFGFGGAADWQPRILETVQGRFRFEVLFRGQRVAEIMMGIPGRHNVSNALAAMAVFARCGVDLQAAAEAVGRFRGAQRRLTLRGTEAGVHVVDDYAHHPTEIQVTLKAAREFYTPRKMFVVFQPHQHSRTRFLLNDFARSFSAADVVVVPDIYFVRDSESERELVAATDLVNEIHRNGGEARYEPDFGRIVAMLCDEVQPGDLVITMGAGNVWQIADSLLAELKEKNAQPRNITPATAG